MSKLLKDIFTDNSGDYDIVSITAMMSFIVFFALSVYSVVWKGNPFDYVNYGLAVTGLIGALGGAYHLKANKEPK